MSIGANLERIRRTLGLSQKEICTKAGLSENSYRRIRDNLTTPYKSTLKKIALVLNVSLTDLTKDIYIPELKFRKSPQLKSHEKTQITLSCINKKDIVSSLYKSLSLDLPSVNKELIDEFAKIESVKNQAKFLRKIYSNDNDYAHFLESLGMILIPIKSTENFHGLSISSEDDLHIIFYNALDTVERQIFTSFHEMGHILYYLCGKTFKEEQDEEDAVNRLAGYFLVPEDDFNVDWFKLNQLNNYDLINYFKRKYKVSYMTIINRLKELNLADNELFKEHRREYEKRTGKAIAFEKEPLGIDQMDFFPRRLAIVLSKAISKDLITLKKVEEMLIINS